MPVTLYTAATCLPARYEKKVTEGLQRFAQMLSGLGHCCKSFLQDVENVPDVTLLHNDAALSKSLYA